MNAPFARTKLEQFGKLLTEYQRRKAKAEQSQRGWYDENGIRQGGLIAFVRYFWSVLEPETPFVDGWCLAAMAEHLEAVTCGEINRLLMNVPPGFMKSMLTDVFWPAWEWGPMKKTHYRYIAFSYSSALTERDNDRFRTLITHESYQRLYGPMKTKVKTETMAFEDRDDLGQVTLRNKTTIKVMNTHTGWKLASSVGGVATGERGDRIICIPYSERILSDRGWLSIGNIVTNRLPVRIAGADRFGNVGWQKIEAYEANADPRRIVEIVAGELCLRCTDDHPIYVESRGFIRADHLRPGEAVWTYGIDALRELREDHPAQAERGSAVLRQAVQVGGAQEDFARAQQLAVPYLRNDGLSTTCTFGPDPRWCILQSQMPRHLRDRGRQSNVGRREAYLQLCALWQGISDKAARGAKTHAIHLLKVLSNILSLGQGQVAFAACTVPPMRRVRRAVQTGKSDSQKSDVFPRLCGGATLASNERRRQWPLCEWPVDEALSFGLDTDIQIYDQGSRRRSVSRVQPASRNERTELTCPPYRLHQNEFGASKLNNGLPLVSRHDARFESTAGHVARAIVESVKSVGVAEKTYNIRVSRNHTYFAEGILVHNCDDPHSVQEAESERVREETVRWFRESISSRFNDLDTGALVVIMQRVHEGDISGTILGPGFDYCHLMIPWDYDSARQTNEAGEPIPTAIGWTDPRNEDGEPAWPERFSEAGMLRLRGEADRFAWASQYQQSPMPRGGGLFAREWWQLWEPEDGKFPVFDCVIASLDGAFTEDEENDPSALTVWGVFVHPETKKSAIMLVHAWRKHLQFSAPRVERLVLESVIDGQRWLPENVVAGMDEDEVKRRNARFKRRTMKNWGLIEWVQDTCLQFKVDLLLIEAKASGISAAQEISNRYGLQRFGIQLCPVKGDKVARALAVQPTFSQGLVWAPEREWSELMIAEAEVFPKGRFDDLTDSMTQALRYLRDGGMAMTDEEAAHEEYERGLHKPQRKALYPV